MKKDDAIQGVTQTVGQGERLLPFKDTDRLTEVNKTLDRIESGGPFPSQNINLFSDLRDETIA